MSLSLSTTTITTTHHRLKPSSSSSSSNVVAMHWFRKGLRLHDNPALLASLELAKKGGDGSKVIPVYILDGNCYQLVHSNALRANFLVECLRDLDENLKQRCGSRLYVARGDPVVVLPALWEEFHVTHLTHEADETGEPYAKQRDEKVHAAAREKGVSIGEIRFASETLYPLAHYVASVGNDIEKIPGSMRAFQRVFGSMGPRVPAPLAAPTKDAFPPDQDHSWYNGKMLPPKRPTDLPWPRHGPKEEVTPLWGPRDCKNLTPIVHGGETMALQQLNNTITNNSSPSWVASFEKPKTVPASTAPTTTVLSPYLSLGCLSPRTVWHAIADKVARAPASVPRSKPPVSLHGQLLWRDFNNLMAHAANARNPGSWGKIKGNWYCQRQQIPWSNDPILVKAWKQGETGYPWIDACMAQLRQEGWIHHLGRHAVACFLTRGDLWQSWEVGQQHFEEELLDADYALNGFNWLWLSCSGFFYQYFRCYSPVTFQQKNDPSGMYIRKWLPQLAKLPDAYIYEPWKAPVAVQKRAGIQIGVDYPRPIVDHKVASKENMLKMSLAYEMHKKEQQLQRGGGGSKAKRKLPTTATVSTPPRPKKKKQQKQLKQLKLE